jgi:hypothetical protein
MNELPFVAREAQPIADTDDYQRRDSNACEDPLPAILEVTAAGLAFPRETRVTEVNTETSDDD